MDVQKLTRSMVLALAVSGAWSVNTVYAVESDFETNKAVDGIAAVVNTEVITLRQLNSEVAQVMKNLNAQQIPLPESETLQKQVLQRLIDEHILTQEAKRMGVDPAAIDVNEAVELVASRNNLTSQQLRHEVEKGGMTWDGYLDGLRQEVLVDQIRQRVIDPRINVSESEVDALLKSQGIDPRGTDSAPAAQEVIELAQVLIRIPAGADRQTQAQLRQKAEDILRQARSGADFSGLAAANSDGQEALQGGVLGARPLEGWPDIFVSAVKNTSTGQVAELVQSGAGYHILKVLQRGQSQGLGEAENEMVVTQTRAHHILIKLDQITSDEQAKMRIEQLADRIRAGESFEDLARAYSEDASAPQGGDLGWLNPGETVPPFEEAMNALVPGQISAPVRSQFGWHLIRVDEHRERNVGNEYRRMQARQMLLQQRVEPAFDDWFSQVRSQTFIDNRIDPQASSGHRR
ncbi:peptidylprolyl isomerase [Paenalcaligenes hominis]|uniref:peptidylprolyl isomerase n=1 Tax=Paenalcaligenes hominis TaxID=643674 RepID=UPI00352538C8